MAPTAPEGTQHLRGSKWTAAAPRDRELHWQVVAFAPGEGFATLEAVLTRRRVTLPWRELRDRTRWLPGWSSPAQGSALVVGAGLAGLRCAAGLSQAGWRVTVVDKGRGAGGRASTRRGEAGRFDHGAQYLTARDPSFQAWVQERVERGQLAAWTAPLVRLEQGHGAPLSAEPRYVGVPGMSALLKPEALAAGVEFGARVATLRRETPGWSATCEDGRGLGLFELVVVATPAPQAVPLLSPAPDLAARVATIEVAPCWAALVAFPRPLELPWAGAQVAGGPLAWVAHDGSKPGRDGAPTYVLHASEAWTQAHLELAPEQAAAALLRAFGELSGLDLPAPTHLAAHLWRYARVTRALGEACLWDPTLSLGYCGDGCLGGKLEAAFLSGQALAAAVGAPRRG